MGGLSTNDDIGLIPVESINKADAIKVLNLLLRWTIPDKPVEHTGVAAFTQFIHGIHNNRDLKGMAKSIPPRSLLAAVSSFLDP